MIQRIAQAVVALLAMTGLTYMLGEFVEKSSALETNVMADIASLRTPLFNELTYYGSMLSDTLVIVIMTGVAAVLFRLVFHRWRESVFLVAAVWSQSLVFLATSWLVARSRPPVPHLDTAPPTSSWPSGHVSAAVAFYIGMAVVLTIHLRGRSLLLVPVWLVALAAPIAVSGSRLYRGMHFVTDVTWGIVLGVFCVAVMIRQVLRYRQKKADSLTAA